ncbi:MAG: hypothetical protein A2Z21_07530 [Candidatus Fraserbacteria bacterium RBG_16_55_9]|uniref:Cupin type-2 domain-containing protein n=1 Tax=Fraserbacteria sp. (strain RBG_16_55_9) TaxID=1817864 RepID=A0A1F5US34_FRAXR|nr:MAG: hypothetical protein A2Z21_07530 [Candidatus Fraserbacteria bacterium RBG_16_55_9]
MAVMPLAEVGTGSLSILRIGTATAIHYHQTSNEVLFVLGGQGKAISHDEEFVLAPGKMLIVFAGTPIRLELSGDTPLELLVFTTPPPTVEGVVPAEPPDRPPGVLKPMVVDVAQRMAQGLTQSPKGLEFTVVAEMKPTGSVELFRVSDKVELHHSLKENHLMYILKGRAQATIGSLNTEVGPGQIVIVPKGVKYQLERMGGEPLEFILFSTPPFVDEDIIWDRE